jgi:hypothetical protein
MNEKDKSYTDKEPAYPTQQKRYALQLWIMGKQLSFSYYDSHMTTYEHHLPPTPSGLAMPSQKRKRHSRWNECASETDVSVCGDCYVRLLSSAVVIYVLNIFLQGRRAKWVSSYSVYWRKKDKKIRVYSLTFQPERNPSCGAMIDVVRVRMAAGLDDMKPSLAICFPGFLFGVCSNNKVRLRIIFLWMCWKHLTCLFYLNQRCISIRECCKSQSNA